MAPRLVLLAALLALAAVLAAPAAVPAQESAGAPPDGGTTAAGQGDVVLIARPDALLRRVTRFRGSAGADHASRTVVVERLDPLAGAWAPIATATVAPDGAFLAYWRADRLGTQRLRAVLAEDSRASAAAASPEVALTVYKPATATWYGPGLFGRTTACGQTLTPELQGVAHKRHPCGTLVAISYRGRTVTVPVVDRGPFVRGVTWDLTAATAEALGFAVTSRVGALAG